MEEMKSIIEDLDILQQPDQELSEVRIATGSIQVNIRKVYIESYGCQMNFSDSEIVASILQKKGFDSTADIAEADVILLNTCSIREKAEQTIRFRLQHINGLKKQKPGLLVGVLGCMAERLKDKFLEEVVKFVCGDIDKPKYTNPDVIKAKYGHFLPKPEKKGMSKSYEGVPVLLPKGLLNEAISMALNKTKKVGYKGEINTVVYNLEQYINNDTQDFFGFEHYYQLPKVAENMVQTHHQAKSMTEGSNHKDVDEQREVKLKSEYVAELEAEILKLDEEKESIGRGKPKNNKQEEIRKEKLQGLRDKLRDTHRLKNRILDREQTIRYHQANDRA